MSSRGCVHLHRLTASTPLDLGGQNPPQVTWPCRRACFSYQSIIASVLCWCNCDPIAICQLPSLLPGIQSLSVLIRLSALLEPPRLPVISLLFSNLSVQEQPPRFGSMCQRSEGAAGSFIAATQPGQGETHALQSETKLRWHLQMKERVQSGRYWGRTRALQTGIALGRQWDRSRFLFSRQQRL